MAARWALANMGDAGSVDLLLTAADDASDYERVKATKACLLLAERLLAEGEKERATSIYARLRTGSDEAYVREAAEKGLAAAGRR
jgi:HEAT repeat protein